MRPFAFLAALVFIVNSSIAFANPAKEVIGDWNKNCRNGSCSLELVVFDQALRKVQLKANILRKPKGFFLLLATPLGLNLPHGMTISIDGRKPFIGQFNTCTVQGCFVAIPFKGKILNAWKLGNSAKITYQDGAAQNIVSEVSLKGVSAGIEAIK